MQAQARLSVMYRVWTIMLSLSLFLNSLGASPIAKAETRHAPADQAGAEPTQGGGKYFLPLVMSSEGEQEARSFPIGIFSAFGPQDYLRTGGPPNVYVTHFALLNPQTTYTLQIYNGGRNANFEPIFDPISSAKVTLNGIQVAGPSDFNKQIALIEKPVTPLAENELVVELSSGAGSGLTIELIGNDLDLPVIAATIEPNANAADWHRSDVVVSFLCKDNTSPITSCTAPITATVEGANQVVTGVAVDSAGNTAMTVVTLQIDKTAPTLNSTLVPPANANGWHNTDVTVSFAATDALSGVANVTGPTIVTAEGAAQTISGTATDHAGNSATAAATANLDKSAPAINNLQPADGSTTSNPRPTFSASFGDSLAGVDVTTIQITLDGGNITAQAQVGADGFSLTPAQALANGSHTFSVTVSDLAGNSATATTSFTVQVVDDGLPPDPATVAPPLDLSVATDVVHSTDFLYTGDNPIQTGVAEGAINVVRGAVLRGLVFQRNGAPLTGVTITVKDHPEFGQTLSRADGAFDLAVNGGSVLTVDYQKAGYLPAQRQVDPAWQSFAFLPDVVLIPLDSQVSTIDLTASQAIQVARGSSVSDEDGARQATLLFPQGTQAEMVMPDGSTQPLTTLNVRATEYTVGENGPEAMPGALPPLSGYTYAAEFSVDEALVAGATEVRFNQPVIFYVENFLEFPAGGIVPVGYYDRTQGKWIASQNGKIIQIVSITNGLADVDTDGDGQADSGAALGITDAERAQLATLYTPGQSLWRVPITHFTPWDCNWPYSFPPDAQDLPEACRQAGVPPEACRPDQDNDDSDDPPQDDEPCESLGSIIECQNQTLRERIRLPGTPFSLNYASDRTSVRSDKTVDILVSPSAVPSSLNRIEVEIEVAGQRIRQEFSNQPDQRFTFAWNGEDAYGRVTQGTVPVVIKHRYFYTPVYQEPAQILASFGRFGRGTLVGRRVANFSVFVETTSLVVMDQWDGRGQGLGGWTVSPHHTYDILSQTLFRGDGTRQSKASLFGITLAPDVIETIAGTGVRGIGAAGLPATQTPLDATQAVAFAPDGTLYLAERSIQTTNAARVRRIAPDGTTQFVAGGGNTMVNGVPATQTSIQPGDIAFAPNGELYIADTLHHCIRRIDANGIIHAAAGRCNQGGFSGDGGPATAAQLNSPASIDFAADGTLYISDSNNRRIRQVTPDGIILTIAGTGVSGFSGDGGPARLANLAGPRGLDVVADGSIFVADNALIRRIRADGIITTVAGGGGNPNGERIPATQVTFNGTADVAVASDGAVYVVENFGHRIRFVAPNGLVATLAGINNQLGYTGDGGPGNRARLRDPIGVTLGPDGHVYIADRFNHVIRRLAAPLPTLFNIASTIPAPDESELYQFDDNNRHVRTLDGLTGAVRYTFGYDQAGRLVTISDANNNVTTIERDANGAALAIVGPYGQRTTLAIDANGNLVTLTDPANQVYRFTYDQSGLLASLTDPRGQQSTFAYNAVGRLTQDSDAAGGFTSLAFTSAADGHTVTKNTALQRTTSYQVQRLPNGDTRRTTIDPNGAQTSVLIRADGVQQKTNSDGSTVTLSYPPDPRWGILTLTSPATTIRTGGLTQSSTSQRTATLANPDNPLSLQSLTDVLTVNGRTYTSVYLAATRTMTSTSPEGRRMISMLDEQGRVVQTSFDPVLAPTVYTYDSRGRLAQSQRESHRLTYGYDERGRVASTTDTAGNVVRFEYDSADRLIRKILPSQRTFQYSYDAKGNLTSVTLPSGAVHHLGYTPVNLKASYGAPGSAASTVRSYNLDRQLDLLTLAGGRAIDYVYDSGGRTSGLTYPEASINFSYGDATDRVQIISRTPASGPAQSISYGYNGFLRTSADWSGAVSGSFQYTYDNNFFLTGITFDGNTLPISRDRDGLVTSYGPFTLGRGGPSGAQSRIQDNALMMNLSYDALARLDTRTHTVNGQVVYALDLDYENVGHNRIGRIQRKIETVAGQTHVYTFTYDLDGQLTTVHRDGSQVESYAYDSDGNRTQVLTQGLTTTATYNSRGLLSQLGNVTYQFDADGFLVQRGADSFQYSARGELLQVTLGNGQSITYHYDGLGRRVSRTDNTGAIHYLYGDPGNVFRLTHVRDRSGNLTTLFYDEADALFAFEQGGSRFYVATDQVGTPKVVTNASGAVVKVLEYDAFGALRSDSNPSLEMFIGYAGGLADSATGLVRFGWRDYEVAAGRWSARDPILFDGGQENLYVYVSNDPINLRDPLGLFCIGGSAYLGLGGGIELCFGGDRDFSICGEIGLGLGKSVSLSNEGARRDGGQIEAEVEASCAGIGAKAGVKLKDCWDIDAEIEGGVGPFKFNADKAALEGDSNRRLPDSSNGVKSKCGIGGKVAYKQCGGF